MGTFLGILNSSKILLLVLTLFILFSIPLVLSVPIKDNVENVLTQGVKFYQNLGNHGNAKLITKTRTARQSNYPFMLYGGCYPPGQAGGWAWGRPQPPRYPLYNPFGNQNRATPPIDDDIDEIAEDLDYILHRHTFLVDFDEPECQVLGRSCTSSSKK